MTLVTETKVFWRHDLVEAYDEARASDRLVLIELFSPTCLGCQNMEVRTFEEQRVADFMNEEFVPVHFNVLDEPHHLERFNAGWTPTIIIQDGWEREHRRTVGFVPPHKFLAELALARLMSTLHLRNYPLARKRAAQAVEWAQEADEERHAEALYWQAVAAYKDSDDQNLLIQGWKDLLDRFPDSDWAARCDFARDL